VFTPLLYASSAYPPTGLWHIEARSRDVPIFSLSEAAVHYFTKGLSGEVEHIGMVPNKLVNPTMPDCTYRDVEEYKHASSPRSSCMVVDEGRLVRRFRQFMRQYLKYKPLHDLDNQELLLPRCSQEIQRIYSSKSKSKSTT
jgi:hypothetical protein